MESENKKTRIRTESILRLMNILAWVALVGYTIEGGAILISYAISCLNPEAARDLYQGLDLYDLRRDNFMYYTSTVFLMIALPLMKAWISFLVIKTLSKFNLEKPFTMEVARRLEKVSYAAFSTWLIAMLSNVNAALITKVTGKLNGHWVSGEFIFMVGLVFIISQVFKRGVEIQSENELTV